MSNLNKIAGGRPIVRLEYAEYEKIENVFLDIVEDLGFARFPIGPREFAKRAGVQLVRYSRLPRAGAAYLEERYEDGVSGIDRNAVEYRISYNDRMPKPRARFTLWYELGHICLGHLDRTSATTDRWKQKAECNAFARFAIAPMPFVIMAEPESPADIARGFGASRECARHVWENYCGVLQYRGTVRRLLSSRITTLLSFDIVECKRRINAA